VKISEEFMVIFSVILNISHDMFTSQTIHWEMLVLDVLQVGCSSCEMKALNE